MIGGRFSSLAILALCFSAANAQMLIPLYGACTSSVQCVGVAICFNHVCQCPPVYNAVGITCVYAGLDGELLAPPAPISPGPPFPLPGPPVPIGAGPPPPPPVGPPVQVAPAFPVSPPLPIPAGAPFAYPGLPCTQAKTCIGNSICVQGQCGCQPGQVVVGYSCVTPQRVLPGGPGVPVPAPAGPYPLPSRPPVPGAPYFPQPPLGPIDRLPGDDNLDFLFSGAGFPPPGAPFPGGPIGGPFPGGPIGGPYPGGPIGGPYPGGPIGGPFPGGPVGGPYPGGPFPGPLPGPPGPLPATCPPAQVPLGPECIPTASIVNYPSPVPCQPAAPAPCAGGASCVGTVCACAAPFVWAGNACVPPPPPGPPPAPGPGPYPAVLVDKLIPAPAPYPGPYPGPGATLSIRPAVLTAGPVPAGPVPSPLALGSGCIAHNQCVVGAFCQLGVCQCRPAFLPYGSICVLRRRAKDEVERSHSEKTEKND